jgi:hypothetical protein
VRKSRGTARKNELEFSQSVFSGSSSIYHHRANVASRPVLRQFSVEKRTVRNTGTAFSNGSPDSCDSVDASSSPIDALDAAQEAVTCGSRQQDDVSRGPVKKLIQLLVLYSHLACTRAVEVDCTHTCIHIQQHIRRTLRPASLQWL